MKFLLLTILLSLTFPDSSKAITWKEFWEPFGKPQPRQVYTICKKEIYYEQYNPERGNTKRWIEVKQIPCP